MKSTFRFVSRVGDADFLYIVQCEDWSSRADIKVLGEFSAVMQDVRAAKGSYAAPPDSPRPTTGTPWLRELSFSRLRTFNPSTGWVRDGSRCFHSHRRNRRLLSARRRQDLPASNPFSRHERRAYYKQQKRCRREVHLGEARQHGPWRSKSPRQLAYINFPQKVMRQLTGKCSE